MHGFVHSCMHPCIRYRNGLQYDLHQMRLAELPAPGDRGAWVRLPLTDHAGGPWEDIRRAVDAYRTWIKQRRAEPERALVDQLARAVAGAAEAGRPFTLYSPSRGVFDARHRLPAPLCNLRKDRLLAIARRAIADGKLRRLRRGDPGALVGPNYVETDRA